MMLNFINLIFSILIIIATTSFNYDITLSKPILSPKQDSTVTILLSFTGDLMCHAPQFNSAKVSPDSFDFSPVFRYVRGALSSADVTFGNLETVTAGKEEQYTGYPNFNTPSDYIDALKYAGFDFLFTSNNHSLDRGSTGVLKTINSLNRRGIGYTGTANSWRDRESVRILNVKGIKIALLAYTYGTNYNKLPKGREYLVNMIEEEKLLKDMDRAKLSSPDLILVYFHFGDEYKREPSEYQKKMTALAVNNGADIIIGSHPHVIQKTDLFNTNRKAFDKGIVAYSLGNFISNQRDRYTSAGVILNLNITKNIKSDSLYLSGVSYVPTVVFKGNTGLKEEYIIIPDDGKLDTGYPFLLESQKINIQRSFNDTKKMLEQTAF